MRHVHAREEAGCNLSQPLAMPVVAVTNPHGGDLINFDPLLQNLNPVVHGGTNNIENYAAACAPNTLVKERSQKNIVLYIEEKCQTS